jgi:hypothetical protein
LATRKIIAGLNSRAGVSIIPLTLKNCSVTAGSFSAAVSTRSRYACVSRIANGREPVTPGRPRSDDTAVCHATPTFLAAARK